MIDEDLEMLLFPGESLYVKKLKSPNLKMECLASMLQVHSGEWMCDKEISLACFVMLKPDKLKGSRRMRG